MNSTIESWLLAGLVFLSAALQSRANEFRIVATSIAPDGRVTIHHPANPANYYILFRGNDITDIVSAVDMALGVVVEGRLSDGHTPEQAAFFRVLEVPVSDPLDTDGDGIDDVWELTHRRPGAALNRFDAEEDHTGSGSPDSLDYQLPTAFFDHSASTTLAQDGKHVEIPVRFSKPFTGKAIVLLGGTAIPGEDFTIAGHDAANQTARVDATGSAAVFTITLKDAPSIDPDRYILLSLLEPAASEPAARRYRTSQETPANHTLRITEGDLGTYTGLLEFDGGAGKGAHPVRLALRSSPAGGALAYVDVSKSSLFRQAFAIPATIGANGSLTGLPVAWTQQSTSLALQRALDWTLTFGAATRAEDALEMSATLHVAGLSSSGKPVTSPGRLRLVPLTTSE